MKEMRVVHEEAERAETALSLDLHLYLWLLARTSCYFGCRRHLACLVLHVFYQLLFWPMTGPSSALFVYMFWSLFQAMCPPDRTKHVKDVGTLWRLLRQLSALV